MHILHVVFDINIHIPIVLLKSQFAIIKLNNIEQININKLFISFFILLFYPQLNKSVDSGSSLS